MAKKLLIIPYNGKINDMLRGQWKKSNLLKYADFDDIDDGALRLLESLRLTVMENDSRFSLIDLDLMFSVALTAYGSVAEKERMSAERFMREYEKTRETAYTMKKKLTRRKAFDEYRYTIAAMSTCIASAVNGNADSALLMKEELEKLNRKKDKLDELF